jgi:outer membrane protein TolC
MKQYGIEIVVGLLSPTMFLSLCPPREGATAISSRPRKHTRIDASRAAVRLGVALCFAAFFCKAPALAVVPLGLDATVAYALEHSVQIAAQRATFARARSDLVKARAAEYPSIAGSLQSTMVKSSNLQTDQYGITPPSVFSQNSAQIASQFTLYNGSLRISEQEARRRFEAAQADLQRTQRKLVGEVVAAFYALVGKDQNIQLAEHDQAYQRQLLDSAQTQERVGRIAEVEVMRAEVNVIRSESATTTARADAAAARESLALQIAAPLETSFALPTTSPEPPLPTTPLESLITTAQTYRPEIAAARADLAVAALSNSKIDADLQPQVTLSGAFGSQVTPTQFGPEQTQIDAENAAGLAQYQLERELNPAFPWPVPVSLPPVQRGAPGFWQFQVQSTWALPLIDFGQRHAAHAAARAEINEKLCALDDARANVEFDVRSALRNAQTSASGLAYAKASVSLADEAARIAQLQYAHGLMSFTDAAASEQTDLSAQTDLINARDAYIVSLIKLRLALADEPIEQASRR